MHAPVHSQEPPCASWKQDEFSEFMHERVCRGTP